MFLRMYLFVLPCISLSCLHVCVCTRWWENTRECDSGLEARKSKHVEFRLEHIAGVFIVGSFGLGSALLLFLMKKVFVLIKRDNAVPGLR